LCRPNLTRHQSVGVPLTRDDQFGAIAPILWIFAGDEIVGTKIFAGIPSFRDA